MRCAWGCIGEIWGIQHLQGALRNMEIRTVSFSESVSQLTPGNMCTEM